MSVNTKQLLMLVTLGVCWIPLMVALGRFGFYPLYEAMGLDEGGATFLAMISTVPVALGGVLGAALCIDEEQGK